MQVNKKNFDAGNLNFWARLAIFVLGLLATLGIQFPQDPVSLGTEIVTTLTTGGWDSVLGLMAISVIMPIYNFIRSKPKLSLAAFLGSPNTWLYLATFLVGIMLTFGIKIPEGTGEAIVGAIYAKDWSGLISIMAINIFDPIIRWLRDKRNKELAAGS